MYKYLIYIKNINILIYVYNLYINIYVYVYKIYIKCN